VNDPDAFTDSPNFCRQVVDDDDDDWHPLNVDIGAVEKLSGVQSEIDAACHTIRSIAFTNELMVLTEEELIEAVGRVRLPRNRLQDRLNPLTMLPTPFRKTYGLTKEVFRVLLEHVKVQLSSDTADRRGSLLPVHKLCVFLEFMRRGSHQVAVGGQMHIQLSQPHACRVINTVAECLAALRYEFITFPGIEEGRIIAEEFRQRHKIPGCVGVVDGCHIKILQPVIDKPPPYPQQYVNRKGFHSINTMMVVDHRQMIRNLAAGNAGSAHDARIFDGSFVRRQLTRDHEALMDPATQELVEYRHLIGDEGYGCTSILLTQFRQQQMNSLTGEDWRRADRFNKALRSLRVIVEQTFGVLKRRWPALQSDLRPRNLKNTQNIIVSGVILHNLMCQYREESQPELEYAASLDDYNRHMEEVNMEEEEPEVALRYPPRHRLAGHIRDKFKIRQEIVDSVFAEECDE